MGKIDDALQTLVQIQDPTERAMELAGLLSTLFKIRGVVLVVTGELAYSSYANTRSAEAELELAPFSGKLTPRLLQEVMSGQLGAEGGMNRWFLTGIAIRFQTEATFALRHLCRDFTTDLGVVKLWPAEEITAERIVSAVFPVPNPAAQEQAITLLMNALGEAFRMDWTALRNLCHEPAYRVGEELTELRMQAKREGDLLGLFPDSIGMIPAEALQTANLPAF